MILLNICAPPCWSRLTVVTLLNLSVFTSTWLPAPGVSFSLSSLLLCATETRLRPTRQSAIEKTRVDDIIDAPFEFLTLMAGARAGQCLSKAPYQASSLSSIANNPSAARPHGYV